MTAPTLGVRGSVPVLGELAPLPRATTGITYLGPGIAEIKPHNPQGIRAGLQQLRETLWSLPKPQPRLGQAQDKHPWLKGKDVVLVTYMYTAGRKPLRIFALRPDPALLNLPSRTPRYPGSAGGLGWINGLGTWYLVKDTVVPSHPYAGWLTSLGPTGRGTAFEPAVREAFIETIKPKAHDTAGKFPSTTGSDVVWREVAEYLYELAGELVEGR